MALGDPCSSVVPDSDPREYCPPPPHEFKPVGLKLYKPKRNTFDRGLVLREPEEHFSGKNREAKKQIRGFGGSGKVKEWYETLPQRAKDLVDGTGFGGFVQLLGKTSNNCFQLTALAERWWDTTNTLHLPFGEATMTPLDFAAITGIRVGGSPIPFDVELYKNRDALVYFLGQVPEMTEAGTVRHSWFYQTFKKHTCNTERDYEHVARAFILHLFGVALFPNKDSRVHLHYLAAMKDLSTVREYDWGGAALSTLYGHMGAISRGMTQGMGGYLRVWEIWSFEFLGMHVPKNKYADPSVIPRGLKWARESRETKRGGRDLVTHRLFLDQLTNEQVNWDLWAMIDPVVHADLLRSRQATGQRILLEGPFCRQWYLGERVVRQSLGYNVFRVPKPIPFSMLNTKDLTVEDVEKWTKGEDAATFLEEGGDYEEYRAKRLMPIFGARPPSPRPRARAVPTATGGEGAEVLGGASLEDVPRLPEQVTYCSSKGHRRSVDIPSPEHVELALAPSVQQVSREYTESSFRHISGLYALVRETSMESERKSMVIESLSMESERKSMVIESLSMESERKSKVIEDLEARLRIAQGQRVASAGHSASAPQGERASTMGRGSGDDDRDEEDNEEEEEDDEEDNVGSEDDEESEEEDRELASREDAPSGPSSKKPRR